MFFLSIIAVNAVILLYLSLPLILEYWPTFLLSFVFKPKDKSTSAQDHFTCFEQHRLSSQSTRNLYVETADSGDKLGVWHIQPYESKCQDLDGDKDSLTQTCQDNTPVFIYFHGNSRTRAVPWRIDKYKLLSSLGFHVIAFDYRGYGDSTGKVRTEMDCVHDAMAILNFVHTTWGSSPIFFWGHSLGTAVVGSLMNHLRKERARKPTQDVPLPKGIILDAPFTSLSHVMMGHRSMWPYRIVPTLRKKMTSVPISLRMEFNTQRNLTECPAPILILHAEDDHIVPFKLGENLATSLKETTDVTFIPFAADRQYHHNFIHRAPEIPEIIRNFVDSSLQKTTNGKTC